MLQFHGAGVIEVMEAGQSEDASADRCEQSGGTVEGEDGGEEAEEQREVDPKEDLLALAMVKRDDVKPQGVEVRGALAIASLPVLRVPDELEVRAKVRGNITEKPTRLAGHDVPCGDAELLGGVRGHSL